MRSSAALASRSALVGWVLAACAFAGGSASASHASYAVPENDLKAAFVFNFAVFTEWPREALADNAPLHVCAHADSPMLSSLAHLEDKLVRGHRVKVRAARSPLKSCHILYLDRADRARWPDIRQELVGAAVLTVADDSEIGGDGAVIGIGLEQRRMGFQIDLAASRAAGLVLSSKLLRLARSVQ